MFLLKFNDSKLELIIVNNIIYEIYIHKIYWHKTTILFYFNELELNLIVY